MPRFVILEHDHPYLHWDFMLEEGEVLKTWRLAEMPTAATRIAALALGDHRRAYLDYEGPVSGGRGRVLRWDAGTFEIVAGGWQTRRVELRLHGEKVQGEFVLERVEQDAWILTRNPQEPGKFSSSPGGAGGAW